MMDTNADRMRRFLSAVCDALDSADPRACWPEYRPVAVRALAAPVLVGVAVSAVSCQRPVGVKYAGPPPLPDEVQEVDSAAPAASGPTSTQEPPTSFPGASEPPSADLERPPADPDPEPDPPDMVVKYGAPPPSDVAPKYGIPIESVPVEPPPSEPLPGHKYGGPPPGPVQARYGVPY